RDTRSDLQCWYNWRASKSCLNRSDRLGPLSCGNGAVTMPSDPADLEFEESRAHQTIPIPRRAITPHTPKRNGSNDITMTGFHQEQGIRRYVFQCPNEDGTSSEFTVDADVRLLPKYGIVL